MASYNRIPGFQTADPGICTFILWRPFYATSFFWDLLLPKFEPVYGGWFSEWGTSLLLLMILYTLWNDLVKAYSFRLTFSEEQRQLTRQIAIQKTHYQDLSDRIEETVRIRHDFRHHMQLLNTLVEEGEYEVVLNTDDKSFGGYGFADDSVQHLTNYDVLYAKQHKGWLKLYIPARSAVVLRKNK